MGSSGEGSGLIRAGSETLVVRFFCGVGVSGEGSGLKREGS
jgi:hypothetical protein